MTEETLLGSMEGFTKAPPRTFIPSHAIVVVQFSRPHVLYHQGSDLEDWINEVDAESAAVEMVGLHHPDGVFVWSGHMKTWATWEGDYDACLSQTELRPITKEEWKAFLADEWVWDVELNAARLKEECSHDTDPGKD